MQATTDWSKNIRVEVRGDDVVGHAGNVITRMLADVTGLTGGLSAVLSRPEVLHDRGAVLRDVAVSIADGAQNIAGNACYVTRPEYSGRRPYTRRRGDHWVRSMMRPWPRSR